MLNFLILYKWIYYQIEIIIFLNFMSGTHIYYYIVLFKAHFYAKEVVALKEFGLQFFIIKLIIEVPQLEANGIKVTQMI